MLFSFFGKTTSTAGSPKADEDQFDNERSSYRYLLLISDDRTRVARTRTALQKKGFEVSEKNVTTLENAIPRLVELNPMRIALFLSPDIEKSLKVVKDLRDLTDTPIHAIGPTHDPKLILETIRIGADEYLDEAERDWTGSRLLQPITPKAVRHSTVGKGIGVVSSSGGCGSTTTAVNLGYELTQLNQPALLLDLSFDSSDVGLFLDFKGKFAIDDLARKNSQLDRTMLERTIIRHPSKLAVIPSAPSLSRSETIAPEAIRRITNLSRSLFRWVVADLGSSLGKEQTTFVQESAFLILLLRLEFPSLVRAKRLLDHLTDLGVDQKKIHIVASCAGQPADISTAKVQKALQKPMYHAIPEDGGPIKQAINNGSPVCLESPKSKAAESYRLLAQKIASDDNKQH